jgi:hypothetical protein
MCTAAVAAAAAAADFCRDSRARLKLPRALQACKDLAVQGSDDNGFGAFDTNPGGVALAEDTVEADEELGLCVEMGEGRRLR